MGAFDKLFGKIKVKKELGAFFQMLDGYAPAFTTYDGGVYEMELTRACIHAFANHCSKLTPSVNGADPYGLKPVLEWKPNYFHTTAQFLYKAATIYKAQNTCFIIPVLDEWDRTVGYYPAAPNQTEIRDMNGTPYLVYTFGTGEKLAVELYRVGIVSRYLYTNDIVGEDNSVLNPTMQLLSTQNQGIAEGIKNSASFRFMAVVNNFAKGGDIAKERKKWVDENLGPDSGGLALFPNSYTNVQQIQSAQKIVEPEQMKIIENRVYTYFGSNEKILLNQASGDDWSAYYEGEIEPFALQLAQAMTCMTYTANQRARKNAIVWTANRLQYMTNQEKLLVSQGLFDRGIASTNMVMDIWQLPHVPDGDKRYIRKEYTEINQLDAGAQVAPTPTEPEPTEPGPTDPNNPAPKEGGDNDPE
jgi:hypothetical protein